MITVLRLRNVVLSRRRNDGNDHLMTKGYQSDTSTTSTTDFGFLHFLPSLPTWYAKFEPLLNLLTSRKREVLHITVVFVDRDDRGLRTEKERSLRYPTLKRPSSPCIGYCGTSFLGGSTCDDKALPNSS